MGDNKKQFDYNYMHLLKAYYYYNLAASFSSNGPVVFLAILDIANKLQWKEWISISNEELSKKTHLSIPTVKRVKQKMKSGVRFKRKKLVKIEEGNSHKSPEYAISYAYLTELYDEIPEASDNKALNYTSVQTEPQDDSEGQFELQEEIENYSEGQFEPSPDQFEPSPDQFEPSPDQFEPPPNTNALIGNKNTTTPNLIDNTSKDLAVVVEDSNLEKPDLLTLFCEIAALKPTSDVKKTIGGLVTDHGYETVEKMIHLLKETIEANTKPISNRVGWLISACKDGYEGQEMQISKYAVSEPKDPALIASDALELRQGASVPEDAAQDAAVGFESFYLRRNIAQLKRDYTSGKRYRDPGAEIIRRIQSGYEPQDYPDNREEANDGEGVIY